MVNSKPYVIGIDMGGTNTVFGIVDARGVVLTSDSPSDITALRICTGSMA